MLLLVRVDTKLDKKLVEGIDVGYKKVTINGSGFDKIRYYLMISHRVSLSQLTGFDNLLVSDGFLEKFPAKILGVIL